MLTGAADGSIVVTYSADFATRHVVKLRHDGRNDTTFTPPPDPGSVLLLLRGGRLLTSKPPYLLEADGRAVAGFALPPDMNASLPLDAAMAYPDDRFLVTQGTALSRYAADGTLDPTFVYSAPSVTGDRIHPGKMCLDSRSRVYVAAEVVSPNGDRRSIVFRITSTGAYDLSFQTQLPAVSFGWVSIETLSDGRVFRVDTYLPSGVVSETWTLLHEDGTTDSSWAGSASPYYFDAARVDALRARIFTFLDTNLSRLQIGSDSVHRDTDFYAGVFHTSRPALELDDDGDLLVGGDFSTWDGAPANGLVRLLGDDSAAIVPIATVSASDYSPHLGQAVTLSADIQRGAGPFSYRWIALDGQPLPPDASGATLMIQNFQPQHLGKYQVAVTGRAGTALSAVLDLRGQQRPPYLANLSARGHTGDGEDMLIAGVIVNQDVTALIRGVGPGLSKFGVSGVTTDPELKLFSRDGSTIAENDNWEDGGRRDSLLAIGTNVGAFALDAGSRDAAMERWLGAGAYTAHLQPAAGTAHGIAMLEIYADTTPRVSWMLPATLPLRNLSVRAKTGPGDATAIAGVIIVDPANLGRPVRVLLRAVGPALSSYGITHPLANPVLNVFNVNGEKIASNDDWSVNNTSADPTKTAAAMKQVGAFELPAGSKDAALLLDLPPGAYTMHANGGEGVVLLEIYLVR